MIEIEKFLLNLENCCKEKEIDFKVISGWILNRLKEKILKYYITIEQNPEFPQTIMDVLILTKRFIYDFDIRKDARILSFYQLSDISGLYEEELTEKIFLRILIGGISVLAVVDNKNNVKQLREFVDEIYNSVWG